ncbi:hypothetical protein MIND_00784800 [Mycena indigotica]|uniref:Uncharacterized protein n=1 Tax=Mycena indigotica TaxID=2126181 RepID=A0A8H6SMR4_9AGAR|nr:uncharacterized protein MIND_00784800 [Mycena indigotica]KAF7302179.1 hypothetical protein MIND_00784800 [Mycena indigotica]
MQNDPLLPKLIPLPRPNLPTGAYRSPSPSRRTNVAMIYARPSYSAFKEINAADEARRRAEFVTPELDDAATHSGLTPPTPTPTSFPSKQARLLDPHSPDDDSGDGEEYQMKESKVGEAQLGDDFVENNLLSANQHPDLTMVDALAYINFESALEDPAVNDALEKLFNSPAFYEAAELVLLPEETPDLVPYAKDLVLYMNDQAINDEHLVPGGGARLADDTVFRKTFLTALESSAPTAASELLGVNSNNRGSFDSDIIPVFSKPSAVENNLSPANQYPDPTMVDALAYTNLESASENLAVNDALDKLFNTPAFYNARSDSALTPPTPKPTRLPPRPARQLEFETASNLSEDEEDEFNDHLLSSHRPPPRIFRIFLTKLCQWGQQVAIAFVEIPGALLDDQTKEILDNLFDNPMFRAVLSRAAETINSPSVNDPSVNLSDEILTLLNTQAFTDPNLISQDGGPSTAVTRAHLAALHVPSPPNMLLTQQWP